jgi:hypothetical protein
VSSGHDADQTAQSPAPSSLLRPNPARSLPQTTKLSPQPVGVRLRWLWVCWSTGGRGDPAHHSVRRTWRNGNSSFGDAEAESRQDRKLSCPVLRDHAGVFEVGDRLQLIVAFPESVRRAGRQIRSSRMKLSAFAMESSRHSIPSLIPYGTTTLEQLSRLNTDPVDLHPPASDLCFLGPTGSATGLVASLCPRKDSHLLDNINWFHRGCQPRIPTVTNLTRHDNRLFDATVGLYCVAGSARIGFLWIQVGPNTKRGVA